MCGLGIFDLFDFLTAKIMLPLGGMFIALFSGWYLDKNLLKDEVTNGGKVKFYCFKGYIFLLRYIAPVAIAIIFLRELNLF